MRCAGRVELFADFFQCVVGVRVRCTKRMRDTWLRAKHREAIDTSLVIKRKEANSAASQAQY